METIERSAVSSGWYEGCRSSFSRWPSLAHRRRQANLGVEQPVEASLLGQSVALRSLEDVPEKAKLQVRAPPGYGGGGQDAILRHHFLSL
jgi:hypothetical protein